MDGDISAFQNFEYNIPECFRWFPQSRYGVFVHWGPYAVTGQGEQALFRNHMDQVAYEKMACAWNPTGFDAEEWAKTFKKAGFRYACLTSRHHDGYCLWNTKTTNYSSFQQAPKRDFLKEYCEALRKEGIKVGLYYSWADWRIPAYYDGPERDFQGWESMKQYIHTQLEELCTEYGKIDYFFFDGVWPRNAEDLDSREIIAKIRVWQPGIIVNNRLGFTTDPKQLLDHGGGSDEGDFGTPERLITPEKRLWESCQVSTWRWWGYHSGERWKTTEEFLDTLCSCVASGGNLILNVGPLPSGELPKEFVESVLRIGSWLEKNAEAIFDTDGGNLTESLTFGYETIRKNNLYVILRFVNGDSVFRLPDITSEIIGITVLETGRKLSFRKIKDDLSIDMPKDISAMELFPVLRIECKDRPTTNSWGLQRNWEGDPYRVSQWAKERWEKSGYNAL